MKDSDPTHALDPGLVNERWAKRIVQELISQGVRTFCIAPGSRSAPLTVAAASAPLAQTLVHYDERGLGFYALGRAKGSGEAVAVIVTSGSAVGNLLPAVMEAFHDHIPLILLTADRPPELRDTGANQTTVHTKIFQNFVRWECDFPCPDPTISEAFIGTTIAQGMSHALSHPKGPVHFNCMYRKPLLSSGDSMSCFSHLKGPQTHLVIGSPQIDETTYELLAHQLSKYEKGLILIGGTAAFEQEEGVYILSRLLGWPLFVDLLSPLRRQGQREETVSYYDLVLHAIQEDQGYRPDAILQLGSRFVSTHLTDWIVQNKPALYCQVAPYPQRTDCTHLVTCRITTDLSTFLQKLPHFLPKKSPSPWKEMWIKETARVHQKIKAYFNSHSSMSEPYLFHYLMEFHSPLTAFFFSNSLPIRNGNLFFFPKTPCGPIYGNRGLSGIDGTLATIAGIAKGRESPLIACIGDLSFLHDLNSLSLFSRDIPLKLIVINNNGGDIFSFLPISQRKDPYLFKTYFTAPHSLPLNRAAALFDIPYANPHTVSELKKALSTPTCTLIELKTKGGENQKIHREIRSSCTS